MVIFGNGNLKNRGMNNIHRCKQKILVFDLIQVNIFFPPQVFWGIPCYAGIRL